MKKVLFFAAFSLALFANEVIKVGITPYPNAYILEQIAPDLAAQGYELKAVEFNDYIQPNMALDYEEIDLNLYQHEPFLREFNASKGTNLVAVAKAYLPPIAGYSKRIKDIKNLKIGALIYIPNDPTNESRALDILAAAGLIKLDLSAKFRTVLDIVENPLNLVIKELEAAQIPRTLDECDLAVINTNYALAAGLNPVKDSIILEELNSPYVNVVAAKKGHENDAKTKAFIKALQSEKVRHLLEKEFKGAIIPAF